MTGLSSGNSFSELPIGEGLVVLLWRIAAELWLQTVADDS